MLPCINVLHSTLFRRTSAFSVPLKDYRTGGTNSRSLVPWKVSVKRVDYTPICKATKKCWEEIFLNTSWSTSNNHNGLSTLLIKDKTNSWRKHLSQESLYALCEWSENKVRKAWFRRRTSHKPDRIQWKVRQYDVWINSKWLTEFRSALPFFAPSSAGNNVCGPALISHELN